MCEGSGLLSFEARRQWLGPWFGSLSSNFHLCVCSNAVARLVGAPPGYVGYGDGGLLTEAIRWVGVEVVLHMLTKCCLP